MNIWRIHLKPASHAGIDPRQLCIDKGIVGVGWKISSEAKPILWNDYLKAARSEYGDKNRGWLCALNAMKSRMQINDLIWTRDWYGVYYLGRITSNWRYETSDECVRADIVNVRNCEWHKIGTVEAVPGKVVNSFRLTRTVQAIYDDSVSIFSRLIYNQKSKRNFYQVENLSGKNIFSLLSSDDCEDILAIYLQVMRDYYLIPSSCKYDMMTYEYELKHRKTGKSAVAQVKNGQIPLDIAVYSKIETDIVLFTTFGEYRGSKKTNVLTIEPDVIQRFLYEQTHLLPDKMRIWIDLTRPDISN